MGTGSFSLRALQWPLLRRSVVENWAEMFERNVCGFHAEISTDAKLPNFQNWLAIAVNLSRTFEIVKLSVLLWKNCFCTQFRAVPKLFDVSQQVFYLDLDSMSRWWEKRNSFRKWEERGLLQERTSIKTVGCNPHYFYNHSATNRSGCHRYTAIQQLTSDRYFDFDFCGRSWNLKLKERRKNRENCQKLRVISLLVLLNLWQENMLNVPFVEITSIGFITYSCPKNRLLWIVALSVSARPFYDDAATGILVSPYRNSQRAICGTCGSE